MGALFVLCVAVGFTLAVNSCSAFAAGDGDQAVRLFSWAAVCAVVAYFVAGVL